ncbi:winged helix-turn-helix domain-containing protein [Stenotrophomonas sp. NLF4-10]|uniref:winged helix-turn-helix domain-containing protein n=1 Tax=Stenotrophomonas sp. NLF4-10 TaxID=2918754 RepID=UPI001EFBE035|nr:winged helix-turn-helix domain-containing protein [Stenotrophomonas sp. NLF4-10]MCG8277690.1 winged helix-turn-helix domain-containing protein [Stenotrophomonas sp. NLF4-10]
MEHIDNDMPALDRLHIGECLVVLSSREVHAPGARRPVRLTPKAASVLLVLARNAGNVVTRDDLFAQVWPDTLPTNDVLTQAITQLRKAFAAGGASADGHSSIETIAKSGYRLLAPVTWDMPEPLPPRADVVVDAAAQAAVAPPAPIEEGGKPRNWRRMRRRLLWLVGLALLCSTLLLAWLLWQRSGTETLQDAINSDGTRVIGSPEPPYRLITTTEGFETWPALSPDGALVVYADESGRHSTLKVQSTGNAPAVALAETPDDASDRLPAWSPDGREIAFARFREQGQCEVLVRAVTGGDERRVADCNGADMLSFDWTPDGRGLVFGSMTGPRGAPGIRILDLASGRWTALDYTRGPDDFDYAPRFSPDGRHIGFARNPQVGDLWLMDADGGNARRMTEDAAELRGWSWMDDATMVFGRRVGTESRLYRLDVSSRKLQDMDVDDAQSPAVARLKPMLAFVHRRPQFGLFRIALDGSGDSQRLFASSGRDAQPMVAPDGRQLAFTSDRSGIFGLWWGRLDQPDSLRLVAGLRPEARQAPDWAADSRRLLVSGRDEAGHPGIYEVEPAHGRWQRLPVSAYEPLQAVYGPSPERLYVIERDADERMVLVLFDRSRIPWQRLASLTGVSQVRYDRSSMRVLFTRLAGGGLWQADAALSPDSVRQINEVAPSRWRYRTWAVGAGGVIEYLRAEATCQSRLIRLDGPEHGTSRCLHADASAGSNGLSLAPDGDAAYVALAVNDGTNIGVMPVPKEHLKLPLGVLKWLPQLGKSDS